MAASNIQTIVRLTTLQEGILYHCLEGARTGAYHDQYHCILSSGDAELHPAAFAEAWREVLQRHQVLRSLFTWEGRSRPLQVVKTQVKLPLQQQDWREISAPDQRARLRGWLQRDRDRGFDLARAPLMRLALMRLDQQRWQFVWSFHHLVLDGWSMRLLLQEALALYAASIDAAPLKLPQVPAWESFIAWQDMQDEAAGIAYFEQELAGFHTPNVLCAAALSPSAGSTSEPNAMVQHVLGAELTGALNEAARAQRVTLNTLVSAAWASVLAQYSDTHDVVFGTTVAGRSPELPGAQAIAGLMINTLPLRVSLAPQQPLGPWLAELQRRQAQMRAHEHTSLAAIQKATATGAGRALFETLLVVENLPSHGADGSASKVQISDEVFIEYSNYPLAILIVPGAALTLIGVHDPARYGQAGVRQLLKHLGATLAVLARVTDAGDTTVGALAQPGPQELEQVLAFGRGPQPAESAANGAQLLHNAIENAAHRAPDALALIGSGQRVSYSQLLQRADALAGTLIRAGARPNQAIALMLPRSPEAVIGMLGILKSGAAFVAVQPEWPPARLQQVLADIAENNAGQAPIVVTQASVAETLPGPVQTVEVPLNAVAQDAPVVPERAASPEDLAYIMYTSGTTGKAKGVMVTHASIMASTCARELHYPQAPGRFLMLSPMATDSSLVGLTWPLVQGGTLVLEPGPVEQDVASLGALIEQRAITHVLCVPSLWALVLEFARATQLASLSTVMVAGEACPAELVAQHSQRLPGVGLFNEYGPTEAAVWATGCALVPADCLPRVPVGKPVAGYRIYVLDEEGKPVAQGLPGELCIGGEGVAAGYWGRAEQTARAFVPDPFIARETSCAAQRDRRGAKMYRSGDLARWREDGVLEFLGRRDNQLKVRGYRVEPEEIEAALGLSEGLAESAVALVPGTGNAAAKLVAFVAGQWPDAATALSDRLRGELATRLPPYMVPQEVVCLSALTRTAAGKVDRAALIESYAPAPAPAVAPAGAAPSSPAERTLAAIWAQALGMVQVGRHDNFFALGGDSLLSIRILAQARKAGLVISPDAFIAEPTVAGQAAAATPVGAAQAPQGPMFGAAPLTPIQHWFFQCIDIDPQHWNQAVAMRVPGELGRAALERVVQALMLHHDALRTVFAGDGQQRFAELAGTLPVTVTHAASEAQAAQALEQQASWAHAAFDLAQGPLVHFVLIESGAGGSGLLAVLAHHLVVDAVSWSILLEDLKSLCRGAIAGTLVPLSPRTTPMKTWAQKLATFAHSDALQTQIPYWVAQVDEVPSELPMDQPQAPRVSGLAGRDSDTRVIALALNEDITGQLLRETSNHLRAQPYELMLCALAMTVAEWTDRPQTRIDLEGHGREPLFDDCDVSRTVGWFTSTFPFVLSAARSASPTQVLSAVKDALRGLPDHGIGYGVLRELASASAAAPLLDATRASLVFNYLSTAASGDEGHFSPLAQSFGQARSPRGPRAYLVEINALIKDGRLSTQWAYCEQMHRASTIRALAERFNAVLIQLCNTEDGAAAVSDFPLADLDSDQLDTLGGLLDQLDD